MTADDAARLIRTQRLTVGGLVLLLVVSAPAALAAVRHAAPSATGTGDCSGWANACTQQTALTVAVSSDEIRVMAGTHLPTTGGDRNASFQLKAGVAVHGGFAGTETTLGERDPEENPTVLSGDLPGNDNAHVADTEPTRAENAHHVVRGANGARVDGLTISGGNANGAGTCPSPACGGGRFNDTASASGATSVDSSLENTPLDPLDTTITGHPPDPTASTWASFSFSGSGGYPPLSFECSLDGAGIAACTSPQPYTGLSNGSHAFSVRAVDGTSAADRWVPGPSGRSRFRVCHV